MPLGWKLDECIFEAAEPPAILRMHAVIGVTQRCT